MNKLFGIDTGTGDDIEPDVAVTALLIEAARADGVYDAAEHITVLRLLREIFALSLDQAKELHDHGCSLQQDAPDLVRFTRVIKTKLTEDERIGFMQALWQVALSDQHRDPEEDALLRRLAPLLAISDRDSANARRKAQARLDTGQN